ncbi:MAG: Aspartate aminotransferase (EC [uncultured Campylobacterales bacterium]|uniref:cysteine-S-conjugate beta-lyase n=1 Tax=uncultured Campylobacterales bacterium TaxID=352960 RepID=A0A6S6TAC9_9BACT|nr:MAG: Aspartate aminotransferase (EC [uncultured Campylobacterales bacterium]
MDFDTLINRANTSSAKYDLLEKRFGRSDVIPMWIADSEFCVPEEIYQDIQARANHKIYGYTTIDEEAKQSIINWQKNRHNVNIDQEEILILNGVVPSLSACVNTYSQYQDNILIQTPIYPPFYSVIKENDRCTLENPLIEKDGHFTIDFQDYEKQIKNTKIFILCNPHNPTGRVYTKDELSQIVSLCKKYNVLIISDEIHADIIYNDKKHLSLYNFDYENIIILNSAGKSFNIAGLTCSYAIFKSKHLKIKLEKYFKKLHLTEVNIFGLTALKSAYTNGNSYIDELIPYLNNNKKLVINELKNTKIKALNNEGTFLMLLDCRDLNLNQKELKEFFINKAKIALNNGLDFGDELKGYMRLNIATSKEVLDKALKSLNKALKKDFLRQFEL